MVKRLRALLANPQVAGRATFKAMLSGFKSAFEKRLAWPILVFIVPGILICVILVLGVIGVGLPPRTNDVSVRIAGLEPVGPATSKIPTDSVDAYEPAGESPEPPTEPATEVTNVSDSEPEWCGANERLEWRVTLMADIRGCGRASHFRFRDLRISLTYNESTGTATAIVRRIGSAPQRVENLAPGWGVSITVGMLDRSGTRYVMFQHYTGGLHCCGDVRVVVPEGPSRGVFWLGGYEAGTEIPFDDPPADIDGDGVTDFVGRDNRFFYEFTGYTTTARPPPQVWNISDGRAVDVSGERRYSRWFEESAAELRSICHDPVDHYSNLSGACPQYVAAAARVGDFERAWTEMVSINAQWCAYWREMGERCLRLPMHLRDFLLEHDYVTAREARFASSAGGLVGFARAEMSAGVTLGEP